MKNTNTIDLKEINAREYLMKKGYSLFWEMTFIEKLIIKYMKITKILLIAGVCYIIWCIGIIGTVGAYHEPKNDEFTYYNVTSYQELARAKRIEACSRVNPQAARDQITHCATMLTIVTAIESNYMQSPRCKNDKNCTGLKGWQNGRYGFMKFNSVYEHDLLFAEKFWRYHYNKSLFTFVYGFKQQDGSWRYGWTYTQQDTYLAFLRSKYGTVYREIEKIQR